MFIRNLFKFSLLQNKAFSNNFKNICFLIISFLSFVYSFTSNSDLSKENTNRNNDIKINTDFITEDQKLLVHVVPHTHDDTGWNWTFEEYYLGTGNTTVSVQRILDNFVDSLYDRTDRTFIYVEMAFFTVWYKQQNDIKRNKIKDLLKEGRFEFINGGYVMHDEAASYYQHTIDQMRLGLLFLKEEFDFVPEIAWFIDPFGHSASNAYILAKMGFKKIAFVRIDYRDKEYRKKNKTLEFIYIPFGQIDSNTRIFTHVTYDHYCQPASLDNFLLDRVINFTPEELKKRGDSLINTLRDIGNTSRHKNILFMYGCDFTFNARDANFINLETMMEYVNDPKNGHGIKLIYSTPTRYFDTIFSQVDEWPIFKDHDFFPYADSAYSTWTGYFTSRPYLKGMVREAGNYIRAVTKRLFQLILKIELKKTHMMTKQKLLTKIFLNSDKDVNSNLSIYYSNSGNNSNNNNYNNTNYISKSRIELLLEDALQKLFILREKHAITQHHDAVAGTAKEYVSQNYIKLLDEAIKELKESFINIIKFIKSKFDIDYKVCMDPTVDFKCLEDIFNILDNNKLVIKIKNYKSNENSIFNQFDIISGYKIENNKIDREINNTHKTEVFCLDELEGKTLNCKVYFKNQNIFLISRQKNNILNDNSNEINQINPKNFNEGNLKIKNINDKFLENQRSTSKYFSNSIEEENEYINQTKFEFINFQITSENKQRIYFKNSDGKVPLTIIPISRNLRLIYSVKDNQLTFKLKAFKVINNLQEKESYLFQIYHAFYESYDGKNSNLRPKDSCPSGAYILSTTEIEPKNFNFIPEKSYIEKGEFYTRIVLRFSQSYIILTQENNTNNQYINIDNSINNLIQNYFQIESIWDPIPNTSIPGEYLLIINTDLNNIVKLPDGTSQPEFWTDSNGIKMMRRFKDFREGYEYNVTDPVAGNFYPVNSMLSFREHNDFVYSDGYKSNDYQNLNENDRMVTYLNDRSQSVGVMKPGQIIIIQNRNSYKDDWKGLEEVIHENNSFETYSKLKSYIVFGSDENLIRKLEYSIQDRFYMKAHEINDGEENEKNRGIKNYESIDYTI